MKKFLILLLAAVLAMGIFSGCGEKVELVSTHPEVVDMSGNGPLLKKEYQGTFKIEMMAPNYYTMDIDWANNLFFKKMKEETGVDFDYQIFDWGTYGTKKPLAIASDSTRPDIFFRAMFDNQEQIKWGEQGFLRPLQQYFDEYMPNFKKLLEADPMIEKLITAPDGNIYCLPTLGKKDEYKVLGIPFINQKWLDNLGLEMPENPEELYQVLKAFKEQDANGNGDKTDEIPLYIAGGYEESFLFSFFGIDNLNYIQIDKEGKLEFGPGTQRYKECLAWLAKLNEEGLINENYLSKTVQEKWTVGQENGGDKIGVFMDYAAYPVVGYNASNNYVALDTVANDYFGRAMWASMYPVEKGMFAITNVCEYPELMCAWVDKLYAEPYNINALIGEEGVAWKWNEDGTWSYIIPEAERADWMKVSTIQHGGGLPYLTPDREFFMKSSDPVTVATYAAEQAIADIGFEGFPRIGLADTRAIKQVSVLYADISKYIDVLKADVIAGKKDITTAYSDYDLKYRQLGVDGYCKLYQDAYDLYINA